LRAAVMRDQSANVCLIAARFETRAAAPFTSTDRIDRKTRIQARLDDMLDLRLAAFQSCPRRSDVPM
jgi:hypothetical protein